VDPFRAGKMVPQMIERWPEAILLHILSAAVASVV
jgi:hypothetical protein